MKDAVGSTMLVYIVVIVVGIVGSILIASNMYTSAYKAKNNIVSTINRYYMVNGDTDCFNNNVGNCITSIDNTLRKMGYHTVADCDKVINKVSEKAKKDDEGNDLVSIEQVFPESSDKGYCIYKIALVNNEYYYTIVTFSHLNINILGINNLFSTPVYGETRMYYNS